MRGQRQGMVHRNRVSQIKVVTSSARENGLGGQLVEGGRVGRSGAGVCTRLLSEPPLQALWTPLAAS